MTATHLLGIRHHGPGSARAVAARLAELEPDVVLIEGPPEADALVELTEDPAMAPPVALLAYWVFNSVWTLGQSAVIWRWFPTPGSPAASRTR